MAGLEAVLSTPRSIKLVPLEHRRLLALEDDTSTCQQSSRRKYWALTICAHCRDYTTSTCVFTCYGKLAHHREVVLVDGHGARESVGVLCDGQDGVPPPEGTLGTIEDLDLEYVADRRVRCMVSCQQCAGLPLGRCVDAGHHQQERFSDALPEKSTRRISRLAPSPIPLRSKKPAGFCGSAEKEIERRGRGSGGGKPRGEKGEGGGKGGAGGVKGGGGPGEGGCTRAGGREEGRGVDSSASTALAAAAKVAVSGKRARKSVVLDGVSYGMPTFIYERGPGLKLELRWGKGRFLVNGEPCGDGTLAFGSMAEGLTVENLMQQVFLRDQIWWEKTGSIHKLLAAKILFRSPVAKVAAYKEDEPIVISLRDSGNDDGDTTAAAAPTPPPFSSTKRELRAIDAARAELMSELIASSEAAYAEFLEKSGGASVSPSSPSSSSPGRLGLAAAAAGATPLSSATRAARASAGEAGAAAAAAAGGGGAATAPAEARSPAGSGAAATGSAYSGSGSSGSSGRDSGDASVAKPSTSVAHSRPPTNTPGTTGSNGGSGGSHGIARKMSRSGKKRPRSKSGSDVSTGGGGGGGGGDPPEPASGAGSGEDARAPGGGGGGGVGAGGSNGGGKDGKRSARGEKRHSPGKDKGRAGGAGGATAATAAEVVTATGATPKRSRREKRAAASAAVVAAAVAATEAAAVVVGEKALARSAPSRVGDVGAAVVVSTTDGERGVKTAAVVEECRGIAGGGAGRGDGDGGAAKGGVGATGKRAPRTKQQQLLPPKKRLVKASDDRVPSKRIKQQQQQQQPTLPPKKRLAKAGDGLSSSKPPPLVAEVPNGDVHSSHAARCTPSPPSSSHLCPPTSSSSSSPSSASSSSSLCSLVGADADAGGGGRRCRAGPPHAASGACQAVKAAESAKATASAAAVAAAAAVESASVSKAAVPSGSKAAVISGSKAVVTSGSKAVVPSLSSSTPASAPAAKNTEPHGQKKRKQDLLSQGAVGRSSKRKRTVGINSGGPEARADTTGETGLPAKSGEPAAAAVMAETEAMAEARGEPPRQLELPTQRTVAAYARSDGVGISVSRAATDTASAAAATAAAAAVATSTSTAASAAASAAAVMKSRPAFGTFSVAAAIAGVAGVMAVASTAEHAREIELARFAECQRRELEEAKRQCRAELAPLEAEIEALKQKLRKRMKGVVEKQALNREMFSASLYAAGPAPPS